jgi:hypothetical protein
MICETIVFFVFKLFANKEDAIFIDVWIKTFVFVVSKL